MNSVSTTSPLRELVALQSAKAFARKDPARPYVGLEQLASGEPRILGTLPSTESVSVNSVFEPGDILFGKLRPNLRKCVSAPFAGYCSTDILVLRARPGVDVRFAGHVLQTEHVFAAAVRSAIGTKMPRTNWHALQALEVFAPRNAVEQSRIAEILDTVDAAIRETEAVVAKLRQVKAGLLHDLLTRGLDAHGHLRDPARHPEQFQISPFGRTPKNWAWNPLADVAEISSGVTLGRELGGAGTVELPYLRVANVQDGYLDLSEVKTVRVMRHEVDAFRLRVGDVLMNEGGDFDKLGRGTVWRGEIDLCLHQNHVFKVRPDTRQVLPPFLAAVSGSQIGKQYFLSSSKQSTNLASINSTQLKAFRIPCPTVEEQTAICAVLAAVEARLDAEQSHLSKPHSLKRGLAHDLLTGRVRVGKLDMKPACR